MIKHVIHYHQWQYKTPWLVRHKLILIIYHPFIHFSYPSIAHQASCSMHEYIKNMPKGQPQTQPIYGVMDLYSKIISIMPNKSCYYTMRLMIIHIIHYHQWHYTTPWLVRRNVNSAIYQPIAEVNIRGRAIVPPYGICRLLHHRYRWSSHHLPHP